MSENEEFEFRHRMEQEQAQQQPQQTPPTPESSMGQVATQAAKTAFTGPIDATKAMINNPQEVANEAPMAGAGIGLAFGGPLGAAAGAGVGQIAKRMGGIAYGTEPPSQSPAQEAVMPMVQTAMSGLPEVGGVKNAVQGVAQNLGRRALGFTKGMLKKMPGGVEQGNQVAQKMLDEGVIKPISGTQGTLERAKELASSSGKAVGEGLKSAGGNALDTQATAGRVLQQLKSPYTGGAYDAQNNIANEISDTITAHGNGPIDWDSAQALKEKLGALGKFQVGSDNLRSNMYRRAYGIVSDAIERGVGKGNADALPGYLANKSTYGASQQAIRGLTDKADAEASNSLLSLRGAAIGSGALAAGHLTPALEALGVWEAARRYGAGFGAATVNAYNKSPGANAIRQAAYASFIDKVTTK